MMFKKYNCSKFETSLIRPCTPTKEPQSEEKNQRLESIESNVATIIAKIDMHQLLWQPEKL